MLSEIIRLKNAKIDAPETTFDILVAFIKNISFEKARKMRILKALEFSESEFEELKNLINRRILGEPVEYITEKCEFFGREFICDKNVLIPRPETEILVETAKKLIESGGSLLDLCTGTGCVGISLAAEKHLNVILADISKYAIACAEKNAKKHGIDAKIVFHDVLSENLIENCDKALDLITANPPYIKTCELDFLQNEVKREPKIALDGGNDGLDFYRKIIKKYKKSLKNNGYMIFECGYDQSKAISEIFCKNGFFNIKIVKDYNNIERIVYARFSQDDSN